MKIKNKKLVVIISTVILILFIAAVSKNIYDAKVLQDFKNEVKKSENSIVRIEEVIDKHNMAAGTGNIIKWDEKTQTAWIATANHVLTTSDLYTYTKEIRVYDKNSKVLTSNKDNYNYSTDFKYKADVKKDIAVLKIKLKLHNPYVFKIADYNEDQDLAVKGYAYNKKTLSIIDGLDSTKLTEEESVGYKLDSDEIFEFDKNVYFWTKSMGPGNSGGPVLNEENKIIGIISDGNLDEPLRNKINNNTIYKTGASKASNLRKLMDF